MDKNKIKSFAIWARRNLIAAVSEKANRIGISESEIEDATAVQGGFKLEGKDEIFPLSKSDRDALVSQVKEKGFEQVMEEVAYTWFNRFMGLRYMEVNDYLPTGVRILSSSVEGKVEPDILTKVSEIIDELGLNANEIYDLLDTGDTLDREKAYRIILVKQCNELGKIIPQMFEKISDYTELLLPDNLLEEGSVIRKMVEDIEESDWLEEVEIIGWMYQYYISEKKDEVFSFMKRNIKITKENIPAATQLFTTDWIVEYMVQNSLGRLALNILEDNELKNKWKYFMESNDKVYEKPSVDKIEDITLFDCCMGSGHILVYSFDLFYELYRSAGYPEREIPTMIINNNLYGLDIDDRAAQISSFAIIMKARKYNRRIFREIERGKLNLNISSIIESNLITEEIIEYFSNGDNKIKKDLEYIVNSFKDAKEYGTLINLEEKEFVRIENRIIDIRNENNLLFGDYRKVCLDIIPKLIIQARIITKKYHVCITNPPYMAQKGMSDQLKKYLESNYPNSKADLFATFIEKCLNYTKKYGFTSMITMESWLFLSSYEEIRKGIVNNKTIINMIHMPYEGKGKTSLGISFGTTAFIIKNEKLQGYEGQYSYIRYTDIDEKGTPIKFPTINERYKKISINNFEKIPSNTIAYWIDDTFLDVFKHKSLSEYCFVKKGMDTGNNDKFLRLWYEVNKSKIGFNLKDGDETISKNKKWVPYNKGGAFRKWYGNNEYIINWENNGIELKETKKANIRSKHLYFKEALTWTLLSSGNQFGVRYVPSGYIFDSNGSSIFSQGVNIKYIQGLLLTKIVDEVLKIYSSTMAFNISDVAKIPIIIDKNIINEIEKLVDNNINISKNEWDSFEESWNFKTHPLIYTINRCESNKLSCIFEEWKKETETNFNLLKSNEERINKFFIDVYGLKDTITPIVRDENITLRKADLEREVKSLISYAVGCMFGRYSIDTEGLIYAGGKFEEKWDIKNKIVRKLERDDKGVLLDTWIESRFVPDRENIIPITEDEYFEDDIVSRFINFIRTVYGEEYLEENLDFIADALGRKVSETSRQAIRRYFLKDFYKEHLKIYKSGNSGSRPIYWLLDSGKDNGFKAVIYMHRYNEQTIAKVRTEYLHTLQRKYESEISRLQLVVDSDEYTTKDRTAAKKKIDRISKQLEECKEYDQVVAHLANEKISIDLDDGVKVNYAKFQDVKLINSKGKEVKMNLLAKI